MLTLRSRSRPISFARSRLFLGITAVGSGVLVALSLLWTQAPVRMLSTTESQPVLQAAGSLALVFMLWIALFLPFDLVGGAWLVRRRVTVSDWLRGWARGAALQLMVWSASALLLLLTVRAAGGVSPHLKVVAATIAFVVIQLLLAAARGHVARAAATLPAVPLPDRLRRAAQHAGIDPAVLYCVRSADESFVGGWSGVLPRRLIVPERWAELSETMLAAVLIRRRIIGASGAHTRGVLAAIAWNTLGFIAVMLVTGAAPGTAAGIVTVAAGMTLWAFISVLLLPTPSRAAVYAIDQATASISGMAPLREAIAQLDRWQDDEPTRSRRVEAIFHPVPAAANRLARLPAGRPLAIGRVGWWHLHHVARHALYLGWAGMTPLSRAVHCNVGRPALWVMLPGD